MGKKAESISIIGGADGPTSIFLAGRISKDAKGIRIRHPIKTLRTCVERFFYEKRKKRIKGRITARPHTLLELARFLKREYGAQELSADSRIYQEMRRCMKESEILRFCPELLGDLAQIGFPDRFSVEPSAAEKEQLRRALREFQERQEMRDRRVEEISQEDFPMDYHVYEIRLSEGRVQVEIENVRGEMSVSWSGSGQGRGRVGEFLSGVCRRGLPGLWRSGRARRPGRIAGRIYLYYGVTREDMEKETPRYIRLVEALCLAG